MITNTLDDNNTVIKISIAKKTTYNLIENTIIVPMKQSCLWH